MSCPELWQNMSRRAVSAAHNRGSSCDSIARESKSSLPSSHDIFFSIRGSRILVIISLAFFRISDSSPILPDTQSRTIASPNPLFPCPSILRISESEKSRDAIACVKSILNGIFSAQSSAFSIFVGCFIMIDSLLCQINPNNRHLVLWSYELRVTG